MNEAETRAGLLPLPLAGEGRGEGDFSLDRLQNAIAVLRNIIVPEPQHAPAISDQEGVASRICGAFGMLATIQLHDESMLDRREVHNERPNWHLPAEFHAGEATVAHQPPHDPLDAKLHSR